MRSRDGGRPLLYAIALASATTLYSDQYLIGYRASTKNSTISSDTLHISKAMRDCQTKTATNALILDSEATIEELIERNKNRFIEHFGINTTHIQNSDFIKDDYIHSTSTITIPTKCYKIELNDNFATITLLN